MNTAPAARRALLPVVMIAMYSAGRLSPASTRMAVAASTRSAPTTAAPMQRRAFRFRVHPEKAAGYKAWHRRVSPQLLRDLSNAGVRNYSLFLDKDGTVFGYMESADWNRVNAEMSKSKADGPWQKIMKAYIVQPRKSGESVSSAPEEVFHLK